MRASPIAEAASVLLTRGVGSREIYLVQRAENLRFFGGFQAFPGGKVDDADQELAGRFPGLTAAHVATIRELFEEIGILLARRADGSHLPGSEGLDKLRRDLLASHLTFADLLTQLSLTIERSDLIPVGSLVTPAFSPIRFNTHFFTATVPTEQSPVIWPGELASGEWISAKDALASWGRGKRFLSPPSVTLLEVLAERPIAELASGLQRVMERLEAGELPPIRFAPDVDMLPLRCDGLPPSTHTNAFLIGRDLAYLLDPAPTDPAEQERLFVALDRHAAAGRRIGGVLLSHHHPDHIGAAEVSAERYRVPILAHRETIRLLAGKVRGMRDLAGGEQLPLGQAPNGERWTLEAILTPGHAPGHLVFFDSFYLFLFAGDMVSTLSSVVIAPPEGDLAVYLASLRRLQELPARLLLPAHGGPTVRVRCALQECLNHRREREVQLLAALSQVPQSVPELVRAIYRGLPSGLTRLAEHQTLAGLRKLENEGRAISDGAGWRRRDGS